MPRRNMRTRQHPICTDGGRFRGYGWPATLELLKPVGTASHRHFRMAICPSCLTVHEIGGRCNSHRVLDVAPYNVTVLKTDFPPNFRVLRGVGDMWLVAELDIDYWSDSLMKYTVRVEAVDAAGNRMEPWEQEVRGFFAPLEDFVEWLASVAAAIAEAVMAALSFIFELIMQAMMAIIQAVVTPLIHLLEGWAFNIKKAIYGTPLVDFIPGAVDPPAPPILLEILQISNQIFALVVAIEFIIGAIGVIIKFLGVPGLISNMVDLGLLTGAEVGSFAFMTILGLGLPVISTGIIALMTSVFALVFPPDHDFHMSGFGLVLMSAIAAIANGLLNRKTGFPGGFDANGLMIAFFGLFLTTLAYLFDDIPELAMIFTIIGLAFAFTGWVLTMYTKDFIDWFIGGLLSKIEETIALGAVCFSILQTASFAYRIGLL